MTGVPHVDTRRWRSILRRELPQIARIVFVAAVAWQICLSLGATQPPLYAALVPLVSLRDDPFSAFNLSLARLVGVVAGLTIAIGVLAVLRPTTAAIAAVLAAALLVGVVLRIGDVLNTQVAVSAMLVFSSTDASDYAATRFWETGVGTATTLLLAPFLFPANPLNAARAELARVADGLVDALRSATRLVGEGRVEHPERRAVLRRVVDDLATLTAALRVLGTQIGTAKRSARWAVVRRSAMRATGELEPTRRLAVRLTRNLEAFADEATTLSGRRASTGTPPCARTSWVGSPSHWSPAWSPRSRAGPSATISCGRGRRSRRPAPRTTRRWLRCCAAPCTAWWRSWRRSPRE